MVVLIACIAFATSYPQGYGHQGGFGGGYNQGGSGGHQVFGGGYNGGHLGVHGGYPSHGVSY